MSDSTTSQTTSQTLTSSPSTTGNTAGAKATAGAVGGAAKEHASAVTSTAKDDAQHVAGTAVDQAKQVVHESTDQARHLLDEAKTQGQQQATQQKQRAAEGLRSLAQELQTMAGHSGQQGVATTAARQAGQRIDSAATWLEQHEPQELLQEVRNYAGRKPTTFLLGAALAGVVAGRLFRGAKDASSTGVTSSGDPNDARLPVPSRTTGTTGGLAADRFSADTGFAAGTDYPVGTDYPAGTDYPVGTDYSVGTDLPRTEPGTDDLVVDLTDERSTMVPPLTEPGLDTPEVDAPLGERGVGRRNAGGAPL